MKVTEFVSLGSVDKLNLLFEKGQEVSARIFIFYNIRLYVLSDFFVEVWYQQINNKIDRIIVLGSSEVLDIYEKDIKLGVLFD